MFSSEYLFDVGRQLPDMQPVVILPPPVTVRRRTRAIPVAPNTEPISPPLPFPAVSGAVFSEDRVHRYVLWRHLLPKGKKILFVGLNPSTADETNDDPTVNRMIGFARRDGFATVYVCNAFAFRATSPKAMKRAADPVGAKNDGYIYEAARKADEVVLCYGNDGKFRGRAAYIEKTILNGPEILCFGKNKNGSPKHPLYLSGATKLRSFFEVESEDF